MGALALGDIGKWFPDTDPRYEGADSLRLLGEVSAMVNEKGWEIGNLDVYKRQNRSKPPHPRGVESL